MWGDIIVLHRLELLACDFGVEFPVDEPFASIFGSDG